MTTSQRPCYTSARKVDRVYDEMSVRSLLAYPAPKASIPIILRTSTCNHARRLRSPSVRAGAMDNIRQAIGLLSRRKQGSLGIRKPRLVSGRRPFFSRRDFFLFSFILPGFTLFGLCFGSSFSAWRFPPQKNDRTVTRDDKFPRNCFAWCPVWLYGCGIGKKLERGNNPGGERT